MRFQDYKVVITGATSGIGLATAKQFIAEGATVIGMGRNFDQTKDLGDKFIPFKCNVRNPEEIDNACAFIEETFGGSIDVFVNNAGLGSTTPLTAMTHEAFMENVSLNLEAPILFVSKLYPLLLKSDKGDPNVVITASLASRTYSEPVLYCVTKAAVVQFGKIACNILRGIRINTVSPGVIKTPIFGREGTMMPSEAVDAMYAGSAQLNPVGRVGEPEEVAELICFLASNESPYMNGSDVIIDGGSTTVL